MCYGAGCGEAVTEEAWAPDRRFGDDSARRQAEVVHLAAGDLWRQGG
jgi:hypothetical protein